jgi:hypothetical protein
MEPCGLEMEKGDTMPGMYEMLVVAGILPIVILLNVLPFWMICKKAGFAPALSLLMVVPIANVVLPFYIAFAEWPAQRQSLGGGGL